MTAPLPPFLIRRGLLAASMLARILVQKFHFGMPYFRQEEQLAADGIELDRGTMSRSGEDVGASLGAIVLACADDARKHAFCLSTDATGVAIRPEPLPDGILAEFYHVQPMACFPLQVFLTDASAEFASSLGGTNPPALLDEADRRPSAINGERAHYMKATG